MSPSTDSGKPKERSNAQASASTQAAGSAWADRMRALKNFLQCFTLCGSRAPLWSRGTLASAFWLLFYP